jgi:flagellar export protein FliJ
LEPAPANRLRGARPHLSHSCARLPSKRARGALAAQDYQIHADYLDHLNEAIQGWQARIIQEEGEVERQKLQLQRLHQERRLLSQLKEKQYAHFKREEAKILEKELEAGVLQRWPGIGGSGFR